MRKIFDKYYFQIFLALGLLLVSGGLIHGAGSITGGDVINSYSFNADVNPYQYYGKIASSSIPSPLLPFTLGKIKVMASSTCMGGVIFDLNGVDYTGGNLTNETENVYSSDFSSQNITIHPFDNYSVSLPSGQEGYGCNSQAIYLASNYGNIILSSNSDITYAGIYYEIWSSSLTYNLSINGGSSVWLSPSNSYSNWSLNFQTVSSSTYNVVIYYGNSPATMVNVGGSESFDGNTAGTTITLNNLIPGGALENQAYYAQAKIFSGATLVKSSIIYIFTPYNGGIISINTVSPPTFDYSLGTSTPGLGNFIIGTTTLPAFGLQVCNPLSITDLSGIGCYISNAWKQIVNDVSEAISNLFTTLENLIFKTFPINIFYHINSDFLTSAHNQASSTPDIAITIPNNQFFGGRTITLLNSASIPTVSHNLGFDFRKFLDYIMFAGTGILIFGCSLLVILALKNKKK